MQERFCSSAFILACPRLNLLPGNLPHQPAEASAMLGRDTFDPRRMSRDILKAIGQVHAFA
jgi:hypothetical protein